MTDSEARAPNIVPLSRKVGTRATTTNAQSWRSVVKYSNKMSGEQIIGLMNVTKNDNDRYRIIKIYNSNNAIN